MCSGCKYSRNFKGWVSDSGEIKLWFLKYQVLTMFALKFLLFSNSLHFLTILNLFLGVNSTSVFCHILLCYNWYVICKSERQKKSSLEEIRGSCNVPLLACSYCMHQGKTYNRYVLITYFVFMIVSIS